MFILEAILAVLLFSVLWTVFASPFLAISFFIAKYMRKKLLSSGVYVLGLSLLTSIVVAPVPTPIITFFVPLISLLFKPVPYNQFFAPIWHFAAVSFTLSWFVSFVVLSRYLKPSNPSFKRDWQKPAP
ncbi:hypothetical protein ACFQ1T_09550 [Methylophilus glucosoxydans]|uniref:Uncharacterized protein n=1 Tax=Methylophilus glucosoxydans TaxID=752553 RepID=A0ABW3GHB7_9PROT